MRGCTDQIRYHQNEAREGRRGAAREYREEVKVWRHEHSQAMAERSGRRSVMRQLDVERGVQRSDRDKRALAEHVILHTADTYWPYEKRRPGPKLPTPEEYNAALDEQCESR